MRTSKDVRGCSGNRGLQLSAISLARIMSHVLPFDILTIKQYVWRLASSTRWYVQ